MGGVSGCATKVLTEIAANKTRNGPEKEDMRYESTHQKEDTAHKKHKILLVKRKDPRGEEQIQKKIWR